MKDLTKNYQLSHFCARKVLGSGAYGKVLLVTHEKENIHFALKCISKKPLIKHKHVTFVKVSFSLLLGGKRHPESNQFKRQFLFCQILSIFQGQLLHLFLNRVHRRKRSFWCHQDHRNPFPWTSEILHRSSHSLSWNFPPRRDHLQRSQTRKHHGL